MCPGAHTCHGLYNNAVHLSSSTLYRDVLDELTVESSPHNKGGVGSISIVVIQTVIQIIPIRVCVRVENLLSCKHQPPSILDALPPEFRDAVGPAAHQDLALPVE